MNLRKQGEKLGVGVVALVTILSVFMMVGTATKEGNQSLLPFVQGTQSTQFDNIKVGDSIKVPITADMLVTSDGSLAQVGELIISFDPSVLQGISILEPDTVIAVNKKISNTSGLITVDVAKIGNSGFFGNEVVVQLEFKVLSISSDHTLVRISPASTWGYPNKLDIARSSLDIDVYINPVMASFRKVHRFWSSSYTAHFYTISSNEKQKIIDNLSSIWAYEGEVFNAVIAGACDGGSQPVYRFWSGVFKHHFFTVSLAERDAVIRKYPDIWQYEGVAFCAFISQERGTIPVFRFWSDKFRGHFYTANRKERDAVIQKLGDIWRYEGVAFFAGAV